MRALHNHKKKEATFHFGIFVLLVFFTIKKREETIRLILGGEINNDTLHENYFWSLLISSYSREKGPHLYHPLPITQNSFFKEPSDLLF